MGAEGCGSLGNLPLPVSTGCTGCHGADPGAWAKGKGDVTHMVHRGFFTFKHTYTHRHVCSCAHTHTHLDAQKKNLWMFFGFLQETHGSHKP